MKKEEILARINAVPARRIETQPGGIELGSIWEAAAPGCETVMVLITKVTEPEEPGQFKFVRAVPLSDFMILSDAMVMTRPTNLIVSAHRWMEGPVLAESLKRRIGSGRLLRHACIPVSVPGQEREYRRSLEEPFEALFQQTWARLFQYLDTCPEEEAEDDPS